MAVTRARSAPAKAATQPVASDAGGQSRRITVKPAPAKTQAAKSSSPDLPADLAFHAFASPADFEAFLDREHATCPGFYLKMAKKNSGIASITKAEATEVALCFGWIDGWGKAIDEDFHFTRFTPRRAKSIWSQKNVDTVARLVEEGKMRAAGIAAVDAAKADGRWARAYAGPSTIKVPADFQTALDAEPAASAFFEGLNRSDRYSVLWRIETASPKARAGRVEAMVKMLSTGKVPGKDARTGATKSKSDSIGKVQKPAAARPNSKSKKTG